MGNSAGSKQQLLDATKKYYNQYPFPEAGEKHVAECQRLLECFFSEDDLKDKLVVDVGSSVGMHTRALLNSGARVVSLDLSDNSLRRCGEINPETQCVNGNALFLPFPESTFDHAISLGVLHLTPDCRKGFQEVTRVTAPGGKIVIVLYSYWDLYHLLYKMSAPLRWFTTPKVIPEFVLKMMLPFCNFITGWEFTTTQLRNLLGDQFWTPHTTFHTVSQLKKWAEAENLTFVKAQKLIPIWGYADVMEFKKQGESDKQKRELKMQCIKCQSVMEHKENSYHCFSCANEYQVDSGIIKTLPAESAK